MVKEYAHDDWPRYSPCVRCGIKEDANNWSDAEFCKNCDYDDLLSVFRKVDYSYIFEGAA